jgi:hypothetical protein
MAQAKKLAAKGTKLLEQYRKAKEDGYHGRKAA